MDDAAPHTPTPADGDHTAVGPRPDLRMASFEELLAELQTRCLASGFVSQRNSPNAAGPARSAISLRWCGHASAIWGLARYFDRYAAHACDEYVCMQLDAEGLTHRRMGAIDEDEED